MVFPAEINLANLDSTNGVVFGENSANLGDLVFNDLNGNGIQDAEDVGVANVSVSLLDSSFSTFASTLTNAEGNYFFNDLEAGDYLIQVQLPSQFSAFSPQNAEADDTIDSDVDSTGVSNFVTLNPGDNTLTLDAGLIAPPEFANLGDLVFNDLNGNGIQDAEDVGVANVSVSLLDSSFSTFASTLTDAQGNYFFNDLEAGDYLIQVQLPSQFSAFSPQNAEADDTIDSDVDSTGVSDFVTLNPGDNTLTLDAGLIVNNTAPDAVDDSFTTNESTPLAGIDVLANDTDADGDTLLITALDNTLTTGIVTDNGDGTFNYDPNGQFDALNTGDTATDSFSYTIDDGNGGTDTATVNITIDGIDNVAPSTIVINEVDADTPSFDQAEFIELFDGGVGNSSLDGLALVFFDGNDDASYEAFDLDGFSTNAEGFFVLGNPGVANVDLTFAPGSRGALQNGADAVALYQADASDFTNNTPVTTVNLIDALVYDTNDGDDSGLLTGLGQTIQFNENENSNGETESNSRLPDGTGTFETQIPTPGTSNQFGDDGSDDGNEGDDDNLIGTPQKDTLDGGRGNDTIDGLGASDLLIGGNGSDSLIGGNGNDTLDGGRGQDQLFGGRGSDSLIGGNANDTLDGGRGKDTLLGENGNDSLDGGQGQDQLFGGDGVDTLIGGNGSDTLDGGAKNDTLIGGNGSDTFILTAEFGTDTIEDFGNQDLIGLSGGIGFNDLTFAGNEIILSSSNEVLATLTGVDTTNLTPSDFTTI